MIESVFRTLLEDFSMVMLLVAIAVAAVVTRKRRGQPDNSFADRLLG
jgi:hypothetical protein